MASSYERWFPAVEVPPILREVIDESVEGSGKSRRAFFFVSFRGRLTVPNLTRFARDSGLLEDLVFTCEEMDGRGSPICVGFVQFLGKTTAAGVKKHLPWMGASQVWPRGAKVKKRDCYRVVKGPWAIGELERGVQGQCWQLGESLFEEEAPAVSYGGVLRFEGGRLVSDAPGDAERARAWAVEERARRGAILAVMTDLERWDRKDVQELEKICEKMRERGIGLREFLGIVCRGAREEGAADREASEKLK